MPEETLERTHLHAHKNVSSLQFISFFLFFLFFFFDKLISVIQALLLQYSLNFSFYSKNMVLFFLTISLRR